MRRLVVVDLDQLFALSRYAGPDAPSIGLLAEVERVDVYGDDHPQSVSGLECVPSDSGEFFRQVEP